VASPTELGQSGTKVQRLQPGTGNRVQAQRRQDCLSTGPTVNPW